MKLSLKKLLPRTLFARSLMIIATPILLIQVITTFVFFDRHWGRVTDRLSYAVAGEIAIVSNYIEHGLDDNEMKRVTGNLASSLDLLIGFEKGGTMAAPQGIDKASIDDSVAIALRQAMDVQVRRPYHILVKSEEKWVEVDVQLENGVLHVSLPQRRLFSSSSYIFLLWMFGVSLALLAIAIVFMRNQIRPIRRLAIAAERFGKGQDVYAFKPEGAREVRQAAKAFLEMHARIRRQIQQRTAMLAGVSHDLRTPLTRMKLQATMLEQTPDVISLKADIADMERMIDAYLDFARGEGGETSRKTDLNVMLESVARKARRQGITLDLNGPDEPVSIQLRPVAFERCLNNLVGNARKYADHIWITLANGDGRVILTIDDNGPGIPEDQFEEVFKPFVRGDPSRNPATGGVGLGLPIAQDIIHAHGGEIRLGQSPEGGLRVIIELPV